MRASSTVWMRGSARPRRAVDALTAGAGRLLVGGSFSRIGPLTGGAVALDPLTAARDTSFPA
ncbi:MAG: hypothetical protein ACR2KV_06135 [Solirubrobacteraceae bacterium]